MAKDVSDSFKQLKLMPKPARWVGGVCSGLAYWFSVPTWIVRIVALLLMPGGGIGLSIYLLLWFFVPPAMYLPPDYAARTGDD